MGLRKPKAVVLSLLAEYCHFEGVLPYAEPVYANCLVSVDDVVKADSRKTDPFHLPDCHHILHSHHRITLGVGTKDALRTPNLLLCCCDERNQPQFPTVLQ